MILDRANEVVRLYKTVLVDDGYGNQVPTPSEEFTEFKAFILPVGFAGAGWATNSKLEAQGWADVNRVRLVFKPSAATVGVDRWSRFGFRGGLWTAQEMPREFRGRRARQRYVSVTVEILGDP